jgi:hypothetical protein
MFSVRVVDVALDVTVNYIKILTVAQISFYGKFTSPATMEIIGINFWKKNFIPANLHHLHTSHIQAALKRMIVCSCPS